MAPAASAMAAPVTVQDGTADQARLVDDFLHYLLIAKPDLAEASATALFDSGITDAEIAEIVRERDLGDKAERAISRGRGMAGVGPMVTRFEDALEQGRLDLARNQDRIADAIKMLNGSLRSQLMARRRLVEAGEYAVPALLEELISKEIIDEDNILMDNMTKRKVAASRSSAARLSSTEVSACCCDSSRASRVARSI